MKKVLMSIVLLTSISTLASPKIDYSEGFKCDLSDIRQDSYSDKIVMEFVPSQQDNTYDFKVTRHQNYLDEPVVELYEDYTCTFNSSSAYCTSEKAWKKSVLKINTIQEIETDEKGEESQNIRIKITGYKDIKISDCE